MGNVVHDLAWRHSAQLGGEVRMGLTDPVVIIGGMAEERRPTCAVCHVVIGVYEPILVVGQETAPPTSLAREPWLRTDKCAVMHAACAPNR